jgi:nucleoside 2-deoxyribosyltransferase
MTDDADALRFLADDLEADAQEVDPGTPVEGGFVEGLGRAAGKARARAGESGEPPDRERVVLAVRRLSDALEEKYPGEFINPEDVRVLVDWARSRVLTD